MSKKIFWSAIVIITGVLLLLRNLGIVYFSIGDLWRLWPFIIIIIGVSLLPISEWIKAGVNIAAIIIALALLFTDNDLVFEKYDSNRSFRDKSEHRDWRYKDKDRKSSKDEVEEDYYSDFFEDDEYDLDSISAELPEEYQRVIIEPKDENSGTISLCEEYEGKIKLAEYDMKLAAGKFVIGAGQDENLSCFHKNANILNYSLQSSSESKGKARLKVEPIGNQKTSGINIDSNNPYEISVHTSPVWEIDIEAGASAVVFDGAQLKVRKLSIEGGAAAIDATIGELEKEVKVNVETGASSILIRVPKDAYCEITTKTVLNSKKFDGFKKKGSGLYVANSKSDASCKIYIHLESAVSAIKVKRY